MSDEYMPDDQFQFMAESAINKINNLNALDEICCTAMKRYARLEKSKCIQR